MNLSLLMISRIMYSIIMGCRLQRIKLILEPNSKNMKRNTQFYFATVLQRDFMDVFHEVTFAGNAIYYV